MSNKQKRLDMRTKTYLTLASAVMIFAGCTNDDTTTVGGLEAAKSDAIGFNFSVPNTTRAGDIVGSAAAEKLANAFVVYGTKHTGDEDATDGNDNVVFKNYKVEYKANTAGSTESNTANWEYANVTPYGSIVVSPGAPTKQTVKYWDYSANKGYTFYAFAANDLLTSSNIKVTKTTTSSVSGATKYDKGYTVVANSSADLSGVYYSDRKEVAKADYGNPVVLKFRNLGSRVRVAFYETVPGYSVKINKFYFANDAATPAAVTTFTAMNQTSTDAFKAALYNVKADAASNNLTVTYYGDGSEFINQPKVTNTTVTYTSSLTLDGGVLNTKLAETSSAPTWDKASGAYTTVYPNEDCTTPMLVRCDYTLTSDDGEGETIEVKNARVVIPAEYLKWKPNFAYTYIFKISNNTNGTTGKDPDNPDEHGEDDDPEGLHPISFDAIAVDVTDGNFEDIATVSTNNVITYSKNSTLAGDYKGGSDIYVVNQSTTAGTDGSRKVIAPTAIGEAATQAKVYKLNKAYTEGEVIAKLKGLPMGITMTDASATLVTDGKVPASDGTNYNFGNNGAVKFTPSAVSGGGIEYYAYVYTATANQAATYESVGSTGSWNASTTYYFKTTSDVYYPASGISEVNFETNRSSLYTLKTAGTVGVYDVKVIAVK